MAGSTRGVITTRAPEAVASEASMACDLVGGQRHRGRDLGADDLVQVEHALLERLDDLVDLVDVVVLDDQREEAGDDLRYRLQREHVAHDALLDAERHAGTGERPAGDRDGR